MVSSISPEAEVADAHWGRGYDAGQQTGWHSALLIYGLRNCTICNNGDEVLSIPLGRHEGYIDLAPGETVAIRTVDPDWDGWGHAAGAPVHSLQPADPTPDGPLSENGPQQP